MPPALTDPILVIGGAKESIGTLRQRKALDKSTQTDFERETRKPILPAGDEADKMAAGNARIIRYILLAFFVSIFIRQCAD